VTLRLLPLRLGPRRSVNGCYQCHSTPVSRPTANTAQPRPASDFEWTNKNIMYGSYQRTHSVFQNSDMMAVGEPLADELALLESFRGKVPDEVLGDPFVPQVSDGSGQDRGLLRKASALLQQRQAVLTQGDARVEPEGRRWGRLVVIERAGSDQSHQSDQSSGAVARAATAAKSSWPAARDRSCEL
jgi:hypothetical protein